MAAIDRGSYGMLNLFDNFDRKLHLIFFALNEHSD